MAFTSTVVFRALIGGGVWMSMGLWESGGDQTGVVDTQLSYVVSMFLQQIEGETGGTATAPNVDVASFPTAGPLITIDFERNRDGVWVAYGRV
jgi:hypothetical protein